MGSRAYPHHRPLALKALCFLLSAYGLDTKVSYLTWLHEKSDTIFATMDLTTKSSWKRYTIIRCCSAPLFQHTFNGSDTVACWSSHVLLWSFTRNQVSILRYRARLHHRLWYHYSIFIAFDAVKVPARKCTSHSAISEAANESQIGGEISRYSVKDSGMAEVAITSYLDLWLKEHRVHGQTISFGNETCLPQW